MYIYKSQNTKIIRTTKLQNMNYANYIYNKIKVDLFETVVKT